MSYLLDTQAFLWFESGDERLSKKARSIIENTGENKFISIASFWEIAIKVSLGKLQLSKSFQELTELQGYNHLPILTTHLNNLSKLDFHHGDPFDRLIICQAIAEGIKIISADKMFEKYPVNVIW